MDKADMNELREAAECAGLSQEFAELEAELAECKRDAERYRWLRLSAMDHHGGIQYDVFCEADSPDELDDLIDYEINALALEETK